MSAHFAADVVVVFHLTFIAFAILGNLRVRIRRWIAWLHLPVLALGVWIELSQGLYPLTPVTAVASSSTT